MFADIEDVLVRYLQPLLNVPVSVNIPDERPERFVTLSRNGGSARFNRVPLLDEAILFVECFGATGQDAFELANATRAALFNTAYKQIEDVQFGKVQEFAAALNSPDESGQDRYTHSLSIQFRPT